MLMGFNTGTVQHSAPEGVQDPQGQGQVRQEWGRDSQEWGQGPPGAGPGPPRAGPGTPGVGSELSGACAGPPGGMRARQ